MTTNHDPKVHFPHVAQVKDDILVERKQKLTEVQKKTTNSF